jgi:hypothetical protein
MGFCTHHCFWQPICQHVVQLKRHVEVVDCGSAKIMLLLLVIITSGGALRCWRHWRFSTGALLRLLASAPSRAAAVGQQRWQPAWVAMAAAGGQRCLHVNVKCQTLPLPLLPPTLLLTSGICSPWRKAGKGKEE